MTEPLAITLDDIPEEPQHQTEVAVVTPHQRGALLAAAILIDYAQTLDRVRLDAARVILEDLAK